jgi:endonuclease-3
MPKPPVAMKPAQVETLFARLQAADPHPVSELHYRNPFELLVAVVLSAQATDAGVNKATPALFAAAPTPQAMARLTEDQVAELIRTIGLYRTKARNVVALSRALVEQHRGAVPSSREALEALPGVGRKTANVVLNVAFGQPTLAVDTHVLRVANRLGLARSDKPLEVEKALLALVPAAYAQDAHHWLILHGRHVCKARQPECWRCALIDLCPYEPKTPLARAKAPGRAASA